MLQALLSRARRQEARSPGQMRFDAVVTASAATQARAAAQAGIVE
jgi:hypothetical protein